MASSSKRVRGHRPPEEVNVITDLPELPERPGSKDPARIAARLLLRRALAVADTTFEEAGRDGAVTVLIPTASCWTEVVLSEWGACARPGESSMDGSSETRWGRGPEGWVAWSPVELPRQSALRTSAANVASSMMLGMHLLGISADPGWLPRDLVQAADHQLMLSKLVPADLTEIFQELFGESTSEMLAEHEVSMLTPRLLRLARRLDQSADEYIGKLRVVLGRELADEQGKKNRSVRMAPTLERMHGMDHAVAWGLELARDLDGYRRGELAWADVDRGCLLSSPPGCGKTLFARALAQTCGVPLVSGTHGEWQGSGTGHQGDFLKAMHKTFEDARQQAPCILFVDEIDSFPDRATVIDRNASYEIQVVNSFLAQIDGVGDRKGVVLIGACNHPDKLDPALVRSGRLDRHIEIGLPNRAALASIFREHLGQDLAGQDLSQATLLTFNATGADCERLVRGARRSARAAGREMVVDDLLQEICGIDERSAADLWLSAIHEAGHAVASCVLSPGSLEMVSLNSMAGRGGMTATKKSRAVSLLLGDIQTRLIILLAGRAAEEKFLGEPSSGAGGPPDSDLGRATELAVRTYANLGLDPDGGLLWRPVSNLAGVHVALAADGCLERRVRRQLDRAYEAACALMSEHDAAVRAVARALVDCRVLAGSEVVSILAKSKQQSALAAS